jgi:hypothetical protein
MSKNYSLNEIKFLPFFLDGKESTSVFFYLFMKFHDLCAISAAFLFILA